MRILVVEDDEFSLAIIQNQLCEAGEEVVTATNGQEAFDYLAENPCQMVITDWEMPVLTGLELCQKIRQANLPRYVYVILVTSRDKPDDVVQGLDAGADDFITKPFDANELRVRIRAGERILALETKDLAIFAMAKLAESRDSETGAHLERVRGYTRALARALATQPPYKSTIDQPFINMIYETSPLHDIGKIGIPDSILLKPGRLTEDEFEIMKQHTTIGGEALEAAIQQYGQVSFLHMARDIVLSHHERFDGTGYPRGLAGEQIPLAGRIVSLADAYDALRAKRVYKDAFSHHVTREIIVEGRGTQFDPMMVDTFVQIEQEFDNIHQQFVAAELIEMAS